MSRSSAKILLAADESAAFACWSFFEKPCSRSLRSIKMDAAFCASSWMVAWLLNALRLDSDTSDDSALIKLPLACSHWS